MPQYGFNYTGYSPTPTYPNYPAYNNGYNTQSYNPPVFYPLTYTNGLIGAKAFYMQQPNSTVYLLDSDTNNTLFVKTADAQGKCSLNAYRLTKIPLDQTNTPVEEPKVVYATKADVDDLKKLLNDGLTNVLLTLKGVPNESSTNTNTNDVSGK